MNSRKCKIELTKEAYEDLDKLTTEVLEEVINLLDQLQNNKFLGQVLYNRKNSELGGCRKLYVADRTYRIVYEIIEDNTIIKGIEKVDEQLDIARVISIGPREGLEVYKTTHNRLQKLKDIEDNK